MAHDEARNGLENWMREEIARKAGLNQRQSPPPESTALPESETPSSWGVWEGRKPRLRIPPALEAMGFPFQRPDPPPLRDDALEERKFRQMVAGIVPFGDIPPEELGIPDGIT